MVDGYLMKSESGINHISSVCGMAYIIITQICGNTDRLPK